MATLYTVSSYMDTFSHYPQGVSDRTRYAVHDFERYSKMMYKNARTNR